MSYLVHHGIKGQKWGVRRFQNKDGSLTSAGRKRHAEFQAAGNKAASMAKSYRQGAKDLDDSVNSFKKNYSGKGGMDKYARDMYGDNWEKELEMLGMSNDRKSARNAIERVYKNELSDREYTRDLLKTQYISEAQEWEKTADRLLNTHLSELSKKDYKDAMRFAKKEMKKARKGA